MNGVINGIRSKQRNDEVVARLALESRNGGSRLTRTAKNRQSQVVTGQRELAVEVR